MAKLVNLWIGSEGRKPYFSFKILRRKMSGVLAISSQMEGTMF